MPHRNQTLSILWKGRYLILLAAIVTVAVAAVTTKLSAKVYEATALIQVNSDLTSNTGDALGAQQTSQVLATTYASLVDSPSFLARIRSSVSGGRLSTSDLASRTGADAVTSGTQSTNLIDLHATGPTPSDARSLANQVANALVSTIGGDEARRATEQQNQLQARIQALGNQIKQLSTTSPNASTAEQLASLRSARNALTTQLASLIANGVTRGGSLSVVGPAELPSVPIRPRLTLNLALGLMIGILVGIGLAWLRHALDRYVESAREAGQLVDAPVLGAIPLRTRKTDDTALDEAFSVLRTNLGFLALEPDSLKVITITSFEAGEGKTSVVEGLGAAAYRAGQRVLVVDGDVRTRTLSRRLGHEGQSGFTTLLANRMSMNARSVVPMDTASRLGAPTGDPIVRTSTGLSVLPAGPSPPNPASLLATDRLRQLFDSLRESYDLILIDSPPYSALADASLLAAASDGSIVVARTRQTLKENLPAVVEGLRSGPSPVLGLVVFEPRTVDAYYYYSGSPTRWRPRKNGDSSRLVVEHVSQSPRKREEPSGTARKQNRG
ncbi:MAG TPA: polysaccharide biosynthesis tyrosine autokinase [Gaiellaceae bacterium]|nr:polysaccharide biosynthesis tyrosine autokinase [Gaiellaceae bacterium]